MNAKKQNIRVDSRRPVMFYKIIIFVFDSCDHISSLVLRRRFFSYDIFHSVLFSFVLAEKFTRNFFF